MKVSELLFIYIQWTQQWTNEEAIDESHWKMLAVLVVPSHYDRASSRVEEPLVCSHLKSFQENWLEKLLVLELDHLQSRVLVEFPLRSRLVTSSKWKPVFTFAPANLIKKFASETRAHLQKVFLSSAPHVPVMKTNAARFNSFRSEIRRDDKSKINKLDDVIFGSPPEFR